MTESVEPQAFADFRKLLVEAGLSPDPDLLRPSVCAMVEEMKVMGKNPEAIRVAIRDVCRESGLVSGEYISGIRRGGGYDVVDRLITACIEKLFI